MRNDGINSFAIAGVYAVTGKYYSVSMHELKVGVNILNKRIDPSETAFNYTR